MRSPVPLLALASALVLTLLVPPAHADPEETRMPPTAQAGDLHLRSHDVRVVINNGFATTQVDQVLVNPRAADAAAQWSFPLPKDGSLSELSLWIDGRQAVGEVVEKQEARRIHAAEAADGADAALAEQNAFFDYRIALTRVPAHGEVKVRIVYFQPLDIDAGVGRYLYPLTEGNTDDLEPSFWTLDRKVEGALRFDVTLKTAFPVDGLHCPSHAGFQAAPAGEDTWHGRFEARGATLDRDFVLFYRLRPDVPARVEVLTHRRPGEAEGTFMAVVTPGSDLAPIREGTDWVFALDVSGSMKGEKIRVLQRGVAKALQGLSARDRFRLIAFNAGARALTTDWYEVAPEPLAAARRAVEGLRADGSTNVHAALSMAYGARVADRPSGIVLVSDGVANTGPHHYRHFIELARDRDVRLFTFVIGNGANERLLGDLATLSGGFAKSVSVQDEIGAHLMLARDRMSHTAMHGVRVSLPGASEVLPQRLPSLYLGQQLVLFGRYERAGPTQLEVSARISGEPAAWTVPVELPAVDESNPELERLYALAAIADLERESWLRTGDETEARAAVLDLALRYSLVTDYTSMVVVEESRKATYGIGSDNARRRAAETQAATQRARRGNAVQVQTGGQPLAGSRAAHAPARAARRSKGGGSGGSGAVGLVYLLPVLALAALGRRRRGRPSP